MIDAGYGQDLHVSLPFQEFLLWPARLPEDWPSVSPPGDQMEVYEKRGGGGGGPFKLQCFLNNRLKSQVYL